MSDDKAQKVSAPDYELTAFLEAGCHFGHQIKKWHPLMREFIYMEKDGIHIFDLAKTKSQLQAAYQFFYDLGKNKKKAIIIGTKRQAKDLVVKYANEAGLMYINSRWLGGTLTNWTQVKKSLKRMKDLEKGLSSDEFAGYTKYERVQMEKELNRLQRFFVGIKEMDSLPDALFVIDPVREDNAVKEAQIMGVPVVAIADSNADQRQLTLAIPANDDAVSSIEIILKEIAAAYSAGKVTK